MREYLIRHRINKIPADALLEQKTQVLENIYKELEERGYHHSEVYVIINEVICENLRNLKDRLKNIL